MAMADRLVTNAGDGVLMRVYEVARETIVSMRSINPATGETLETFAPFSDEQIDAALDAARGAFASWRDTSFAERGLAVFVR